MGFWYLIGVAALVGVVLKGLETLNVKELIGAIVSGLIASALVAVVISFFGIDFGPVFQRSAVVLVPLCVLYKIFC